MIRTRLLATLRWAPGRYVYGEEKVAEVTRDPSPSQAAVDFNLKLTKDMIELMQRSMSIMSLEIGVQESINVILSVLALAGVTAASGSGACPGTFEKYAALAEEAMRKHGERRALHR
jgi:hypothetical protein